MGDNEALVTTWRRTATSGQRRRVCCRSWSQTSPTWKQTTWSHYESEKLVVTEDNSTACNMFTYIIKNIYEKHAGYDGGPLYCL